LQSHPPPRCPSQMFIWHKLWRKMGSFSYVKLMEGGENLWSS
jgi:hypothetical protein